MGKIQKPFSNDHDHDPDPPKPQDPVKMQNPEIATSPREEFFPFFRLSGEIRNQIYLESLGPQLPRPVPEPGAGTEEKVFWLDRHVNVALFLVSRQVSREFSDILWDNLGVEWHVDTFELDPDEALRFFSMKYLQRCKLILRLSPSRIRAASRRVYIPWYHSYTWVDNAMDVELTTFGLGHRLSRMLHLKQIHLEYHESEDSWEDGYWVQYRDGSVVQHTGSDLKTVFSDDLRGMKIVNVSGNLCDECAALLASAIERSREILLEVYTQEPEKCIPRATVPVWEDKSRRWV